MQLMGMVKRKGNTKAKVTVENFEQLKLGFLLDVEKIIEMEEITPAMVLNWDHTATMCLCHRGQWKKEGTKS